MQVDAVRCTVDVRERALIAALQELGIEPEVRALELGDIEIRASSGDGDAAVIRVERKTWDDLWASIRDGRFREQRERLRSAADGQPQRIVYVLEGTLPNDAERTKICAGAWWNLRHRDGFGVERTADVRESAFWLSHCLKKLGDGAPWEASPCAVDTRAHDQGLRLASRRAGNLDVETLRALQWSVIPGVSMELGRHLATTLGDWAAVSRVLGPLDAKARRVHLAALKVPGAKRAVGPKLAERILGVLFDEPGSTGAAVEKSPAE